MRPGITSSCPSEQSVSLSSKDMLDGRKPSDTSVILPKKTFEAVPGFSLFSLVECLFFLFLFLPQKLLLVGQQISAATAVSLGLLMCFNPCTCQGSSASYSSIHELGRYRITETAPPLFSKKATGREERNKVITEEGGRGEKRPL